ncbi:hypothetical protein Clacol_007727 [Clathrus columnatus]|uniref:Uncharacterized protein n=1 Tax=Clathrus columnatus TaxID=1419009 RepID=A0AAV5AIY5_9AGAM|nr:hypothetical protein Clacol_007727 [Clathrus columnatus]
MAKDNLLERDEPDIERILRHDPKLHVPTEATGYHTKITRSSKRRYTTSAVEEFTEFGDDDDAEENMKGKDDMNDGDVIGGDEAGL